MNIGIVVFDSELSANKMYVTYHASIYNADNVIFNEFASGKFNNPLLITTYISSILSHCQYHLWRYKMSKDTKCRNGTKVSKAAECKRYTDSKKQLEKKVSPSRCESLT